MDQSGIDALGQSGDGIPEKIAARTAVAAVAGGTASVLSGGKFANGAITGAFAQMYNGEGCGVISSCERNLEGATPELIETLKGVAWALTPGSAAYDCWQAECGMGGWAWAAVNIGFAVMPGGGLLLGYSGKIIKQMGTRDWTMKAIDEAISLGAQVQAVNKANGNAAIRYIHPTTGNSVVVDKVTSEVIHVGRSGMRYGPDAGDLP